MSINAKIFLRAAAANRRAGRDERKERRERTLINFETLTTSLCWTVLAFLDRSHCEISVRLLLLIRSSVIYLC